jgi:hypothetical protein
MEMRDANTTIGRLKAEVIAMCVRKGWGDENGIQHTQHILSAMLVETLELLEHFIGIPEARVDAHFTDPEELTETAEEAADVMMYALQAMHTIGFDVSRGICPDFSDDATPIADLRSCVGKCGENPVQQCMRLAAAARFVVEEVQWMSEDEVQRMMKGGLPEKGRAIGAAWTSAFRELLLLANRLDFDVAGAIARKIGIVDKRVYSDSEPAR